MEQVKKWWDSFVFTGRPDYILCCKLKALKGKLKEWSKIVSGNLLVQKVHILSWFSTLDTMMESRVLTEKESAMKASLLMEYEEHLKNEEIAWRQRSRAL